MHGVKVLHGSPNAIIAKLAEEITVALDAAGITPTGLHLLAMASIVGSLWQKGHESPLPQLTVPTFASMLGMFVKSATGTGWSSAEGDAYVADFVRVLEALGGSRVAPGTPPPFIVPADGLVH